MRVLVLGGYGLIGGYVVSRLVSEGHQVVGAGRRARAAKLRFPNVTWLSVDLATASPSDWRRILEHIDVVVNCAGALQDGGRDRLERVHVSGLKALAEGARLSGVSRFVQVSAAGIESNRGAFGTTKIAGEAVIAESGLDWIILRPGLVFAPAAYGGSALLRGLAALPFFILAVRPHSLLQVSSARDVAEAVARAVAPETSGHLAIDLVEAEPHRLGDILASLRAWMGLRPAPVVGVALPLAHLVSTLADAISWLGWRSPMRSAALNQLGFGVVGDAQGASRLGLRMRGLDEILAEEPSGVQERWFARLYFLKPASIGVLAAFWFASGAVGLSGADRAARVLIDGGFDARWARLCVTCGSVLDMALGVLACHASSARAALTGMLLLSAAYTVGGAIWRPDLWADPMGPLLKILPGAVLALVALAMMDER